MTFTESKLKGAFIIDINRLEDDRGFFGRSFCKREFQAHGLNTDLVQANISFNKTKGTLRGLHMQIAPYEEAKLVRCSRGAIYDVIVDMRKDSTTFLQWIGLELTEDNYKMLYIPEGFAHGFITLKDNTEVSYQMSQFFTPGFDRGFLWSDPSLNITWPLTPEIMSEKDKNYPLLESDFSLLKS